MTLSISTLSSSRCQAYECSLVEANVPYDELFTELVEINNDFANADVAFLELLMMLQIQLQKQ